MRRLIILSGLLALVITVGSSWYVLVEGFGVLDGVYQAVTTLSTVGFSEVHPLDTSGRIFTMVFIFVGVGLLFYDLTTFVEVVVVGKVTDQLGLRRVRGKVRKMDGHVIVCGFGRVGAEVARELAARNSPFVIVDKDPEALTASEWPHLPAVVGDATEEQVLRDAGVERAEALIAAADSDVENTYIVLVARALNPNIFIVARAGSDSAERRMVAAGANRVISPFRIGGRRMALSAVRPMLLDFVDHIASRQEIDDTNVVAELLIEGEAGGLAGRTVAEAFPPDRSMHVLGIEHPGGRIETGPGGSSLLERGDRLIVYGDRRAIEALAATSPHHAPLVRRT
ncbi:MAG: potassium channel protein [Dehalococcoidia bacterium]|nr:potassium channel protein [Dehalococcoidia bacterium]